jgi:Lrp/AsnC family leucine-responsive transcriptional regulator
MRRLRRLEHDADLDHYEELLIERLLRLPGVTDVRSNFALRTVKSGAPLPVRLE